MKSGWIVALGLVASFAIVGAKMGISPAPGGPAPGTVEYESLSGADAFGRARVSTPRIIFDSKLSGGIDKTQLWDKVETNGSVVYAADSSQVRLQTSTENSARAMRQTFRSFNYIPGQSFLVLMTGILGPSKANVESRIGFYDDNDGLFFQRDTTSVSVVKREAVGSDITETEIDQTAWNIDKMDGTGPSGYTANWSKAQIFVIDLEWLGVGRVRFGLAVDGQIRWCHEIDHGNQLTSVYMRSAQLPLRYEITNTGVAASASTMIGICASVISEGDPGVVAMTTSLNDSIATAVSTSLIPIMSFRILPTTDANVNALLKSVEVLNTEANQYARIEVWKNATLTGAAYATDGILQRDRTASALSGGERIASFFVERQTSGKFDILSQQAYVGRYITGASEVITIAGIRQSGSNATIRVAVNVEEIY